MTQETFNLSKALSGALVGLQGYGSADDISKYTGHVVRTDKSTGYVIVINGQEAYIDADGKVVSGAIAAGTQMCIYTATIDDSSAGNEYTRTRGGDETHENYVHILSLEPKDNFAIQILTALLASTTSPVSFDDASIMMYARASYRWAQAMMQCAAEAREGDSSEEPSQTVEVNSGNLQSNTERLLYNMAEYMKDIKTGINNGITVKGTTASGTVPVQTKVTEIAKITEITDISGKLDDINTTLGEIADNTAPT